jgi:hypothetical protein
MADEFTVTIAGKGENVDAFAFAETLRDALEALREVDESISTVDGGSIKWEIVDATLNSPLTVTLRSAPKVPADFSEPVLRAFLDGIEVIDKEGRAPASFPPSAISAIKRFADHYGNGIGKVTFATKQRRYSPSNRLVINATALTAKVQPSVAEPLPDYYEFGEVDGTVENLIGHNELYFSLYDALGGVRIKCTFRQDLSDLVRANWLKRIVASGRIKYSGEGKPKDMRVESIEPKPGRDALPQFKGVYINITGGIESSSYIRELRDDD